MMLPDRQPDVVAACNQLPFVRWDRFVDSPDQLDVYGWIDRPDGRHDFVVVTFVSWSPVPGYVTSSAARDSEIHASLYGPAAAEAGYPCQRVEAFLPEVKNAIRAVPFTRKPRS